MKNDDYLWDGSGEPDPDVERLEGLLGRYRSERPAPAMPETPVVPFRPRRAAFMPYAAAAALAAIALTLAVVWTASRTGMPSTQGPDIAHEAKPELNANTSSIPREVPPPSPAPPTNTSEGGVDKPKPAPRNAKPKVKPDAGRRDDAVAIAEPAPRYEPLMDLTTAMHIEQAETLLRSFRNAKADDDGLAEIALDAKQSRDLLEQNVILRRGAQARKNLAVGTLLSDLEPVLLDIASLGSQPAREDVRAVQQRIEQREIVSSLQLYSSNRPASGF